MSGAEDLAGRLGGVVVSLRSELRVTRTVFRGVPSYIVRDPVTFQAHKLAPAEYEVFVALGCNKVLSDVFERLCTSGHVQAEDEDGFYRFVLHLYRIGLLNLPIPDHSSLYQRFELKRSLQRRQKILGFLFMQVPLVSPDTFLDRTVRFVKPLFSRVGFALWCALMISMASIVAARWSDLTRPLLTLLDLGNLPWLAALLVVLKVLHELGHAYACKVFGGRVPEMGAIFIVGTPCAYVDASAAWGFSRRLHRIVVSLAGMYIEVAIGALALFLWAMTNASFLNSLAYQTFMMSTVVTVLFNVNPLMRYDGYYVISDLVEVPNLRARSQARVLSWVKRVALGIPRVPDGMKPGIGAFLTAFGVASAVYKFVLVIGICALVATKIYFLGVALAGFYLVTTFGGMLWKSVRYLWRSEETAPVRRRAAFVGIAATVLVPAGVVAVPVSLPARPAGIVTALEESTVRTESSGFLRSVEARVGAVVVPGQPLVQLENPEATERVTEARAELEILELEIHQTAVLDRRIAQQKEKRRSYSRGVLQNAIEKVDGLGVASEHGGRFLRLDSPRTPGAFLKEGTEIGLVGRGPWVGRFFVDEEMFTRLRVEVGDRVVCRAAPDPSRALEGAVRSIAPAATREIVQAALTNIGGGAIVVDPETRRSDRAYFEIVLSFTEDDRQYLWHGLTLTAEFDARPSTVARHVYLKILSFLDEIRLG